MTCMFSCCVCFVIDPSSPRNVRLSDVQPNSITVSWEVPERTNGIIQKYQIWYQIRQSNEGKHIRLTNQIKVNIHVLDQPIRSGNQMKVSISDQPVIYCITAFCVFSVFPIPVCCQYCSSLYIYSIFRPCTFTEPEKILLRAPITMYTVTGLLPYTEYQFNVRAATVENDKDLWGNFSVMAATRTKAAGKGASFI